MPRKITTEQKDINELTEFLQNKYSAFLSRQNVHTEPLILPAPTKRSNHASTRLFIVTPRPRNVS